MFKTHLDGNVLAISGRLVASNLPFAHRSGQLLLDQPDKELIVDLSGADDVLDIAGIQLLAVLFQSAKRRGKKLSISGVRETQKNALDLAGFKFLIDDQYR